MLFLNKPTTSPVPDVAVLDFRSHRVRNLTHEKAKDHPWSVVGWSPDGKSLYANRVFVGGTDGDIYRIDVTTGTRENLTAHQGQIVYAASSLSHDCRALAVTSNKSGFENAFLLDVADKKLTSVIDTQWEAVAGNFAPTGDQFTYILDKDGRTDIFLASPSSPHHE